MENPLRKVPDIIGPLTRISKFVIESACSIVPTYFKLVLQVFNSRCLQRMSAFITHVQTKGNEAVCLCFVAKIFERLSVTSYIPRLPLFSALSSTVF